MRAGRGGGAAADFTGGCAARREAELRALGSGGEERQRGNEPASALASTGVGGRVGAGAGRLRRAAASTTHGRHAAGKLCRGRARGAARQRAGARRQASAALGWARPRRGEARDAAGCWLGRLRSWARSEAAAHEGGKSLFHLYFQGIFKCHLSIIILSKKMTSFENVPKMKVA